jgi:hypothetical protein
MLVGELQSFDRNSARAASRAMSCMGATTTPRLEWLSLEWLRLGSAQLAQRAVSAICLSEQPREKPRTWPPPPLFSPHQHLDAAQPICFGCLTSPHLVTNQTYVACLAREHGKGYCKHVGFGTNLF